MFYNRANWQTRKIQAENLRHLRPGDNPTAKPTNNETNRNPETKRFDHRKAIP
jgi:hypothetical protein